jgi:hypothetical protein
MAYQGYTAEIPIGLGGLSGSKSQPNIRPDQLLIARNVALERGTITKEGGATKYNSTAISGAPTVLGGWDWWPTTTTQRMIVLLSDGTLKKDDGTGTFATTLKSSLTVSGVSTPVFVEGGKEVAANNRKLFIFTGKNAVQVLAADGATTSDITAPPADWSGGNQPLFGLIHAGRLWGAGNLNDPHRIYASLTTNHEDFTTTPLQLSVFPGEGEYLVGGISFRGLLVLWKFPRGIYVINTTDPSTANWTVSRLSQSIGGVSPLGAVMTDNDVVFIDAAANFQALSTVTEFGDLESRNLSKIAFLNEFVRETISLSALPRTQAVYYSTKREAHFTVASSGAATNDRRLVIDFNFADTVRFRFSDRDVNTALWLRKESDGLLHPLIGDASGFIYKLDQATKSKNGLGYVGEFQTPHLDLGFLDPKLATKVKLGQFLELIVEPTGNWNLDVEVYWDGVLRQSISFNMGAGGAALGSFVLDTDTLAGEALVSRRKRLLGSGRRISLKGRNSGPGEDFSVARFYLQFQVADETLRR